MAKDDIKVTELRKHLFKVLEQIQRPTHPHRVITKDGAEMAVLVSKDEWDAWQETLEIMSDVNLIRGIRQGIKDIHGGRVYSIEEVFGSTGERKPL